MNAVDRLISSPSPQPQNPLALCGRRAGEGFDMADDMPALHPNDAALALFRDTLGEMRETNAKVGEIQVTLGRMEGQDLPGKVAALVLVVDGQGSRIGKLESARAIELAIRKPYVALAIDLGKMLLAGVVGAVGALLSGVAHHP